MAFHLNTVLYKLLNSLQLIVCLCVSDWYLLGVKFYLSLTQIGTGVPPPGERLSLWRGRTRRNGLKSPQQSKKDTSNASGKSQFLYFIIYSENGEIRNSYTKSYKLLHAILQQHSFIVLASCGLVFIDTNKNIVT